MSVTVTSSTAGSTAGTTAPANAPRLLDQDTRKFRSLKQVIVVGRLGSGVEAIGDTLRILGFKVYDVKTASDHHTRDFPLWLEAALQRSKGTPYTQSDYDKVIGDYNALVGGPGCLFDHDFVKLYPNVKVVMVTREPDTDSVTTLRHKFASRFYKRFDPEYMGAMSMFQDIASTNQLDYQAIRETVREKNLLEVESLSSWEPLCKFLNVTIPSEPIPSTEKNLTTVELAARPRLVFYKLAKTAGLRTVNVLKWGGIVATIILGATVLATSTVEVTAMCIGLCIFGELTCSVANKKPTKQPTAVDMSSSSPNVPVSVDVAKPIYASPYDQHHRSHNERRNANRRDNYREGNRWNTDWRSDNRRNNNRRNNPKQGYERKQIGPHHQSASNVPAAPGPVRPTLPGWANVQEHIHKDDEAKYNERKAVAQEPRDQRPVITATHKHTSWDEQRGGPRKVLSVGTDTLE